MDPCIPRNWREFEIIYRREKTHYRIKVENPIGISRGVARVELDGILQKENEVTLKDDSQPHNVLVVLGEKPSGETDKPAAAEKQRAGSSQ